MIIWATPIDVKVTMNAVSTAMSLSSMETQAGIEIGQPDNKVYTFQAEPGEYLLTGIDKNGASNGSMVLTISEQNSDIAIFTLSAKASNKNWVLGEDYSISIAGNLPDGSPRTTNPAPDAANTKLTFLMQKGDFYSVDLMPSEARAAEGYMPFSQSGSVTLNSNISKPIPMGYEFTLTAPKEATVSVGTKIAHFVPFAPVAPESESVEGNNKVYKYRLAEKAMYCYRVSAPGKVTCTSKITMTAAPMTVTVSADDLAGNTQAIDRDPKSNKGYNVADIFLNADHRGQFAMKAGEKKQLVSLRAWQITDNLTNNYFIEPDYRYTVIGLDGKTASDVLSIDADGMITAKKAGDAIVMVTYDAINAPGQLGGPSFSALWPENTGVAIVRVDAPASAIEPETLLHADLNTDSNQKISAGNIDAEHDVLYFTDNAANYTFSPKGVADVLVASPAISDNGVTYNGFSADGVKKNADGSYTVDITEGRNIIKMTDVAGNAEYQVVRGKKFAYSIVNNTAEGENPKPGDEVTVKFETIYHPALKLAGVYNMNANLTFAGSDGAEYKGAADQYLFHSKENTQSVTLTIPADWDPAKPFALGNGAVMCSGFGDPYGGHREITYTSGKNPNFAAQQRKAYFGAFPEIPLYKPGTSADEGIVLLTFEDADYKGNVEQAPFRPEGMTASNYWTLLIDSKQYNGPMLYGNVAYAWCDANNTGISGGINESYGEYMFWNGGAVISNYTTNTLTDIDYTKQLMAYTPDGGNGGADGSANFLVCNGNLSEYSDSRPILKFADADAKPLYAYINLNAYALNSAKFGSGFSPKPKDTDYVDIVAEPLDENGNSLGEGVKIRVLDGPDKIVETWIKWELSALGACRAIRFNVLSSLANEYGLTFPAYFMLDNIAVEKDGSLGIDAPVIDNADRHDDAIYTITGIRVKEATAPGIYIINGKKVIIK